MNRPSRRGLATLFALLISAAPLAAQDGAKFVPIPEELKAKYRFNFQRNFYSSPEAERAERKKLEAVLKELGTLKGKVTTSAPNLLRAFHLLDRATAELYPHVIYLNYRYATNTKDEKSQEEYTALWADHGRRTTFVRDEVMRLDAKTAAAFLKQKPELKAYAQWIEGARRARPHILSLKEEELLSEIRPYALDWQAALYQKALDRTPFGKVAGGGSEIDVYQQEQEWSNSPDRAVREAGFKKLYGGFASHRDLYAFDLSRLIRTLNRFSQLRKFPDAPTNTYFDMYLTTPEVKEVYERLAQGADLMKRYERLRADRIKKVTGYEEVNAWDLSVVPPGFERPRFTIGETTRIVKESLKPLGEEYAGELAALLDPENGRMDIVGGENRVPGANAWGFAGRPASVFFSFNYEGYYDDIDALTHEAGHAVHYQLIGRNKVRPVFVDSGPSYFFEAFATFNELLTSEYLYEGEKDPQRKTYFLEQFLVYAMATFSNTRTAAMEQAFYDASKEGKLSTADDFDRITKEVGSRYSIWPARQDELKMRWIAVHHFHDSPLYNVNYVYANLLALKFYEMYTRDPKGFTPKYLALMRNGFDAPPAALLKKFLNVDIRNPRFVPDALGVLEGKVKALETLYAQQ